MRWNILGRRRESFGERLAMGLKRAVLLGGLFTLSGVVLGRLRRIEEEKRIRALPASERFRFYADREEARERLRSRPGERGPIRSRTAYLFARASGRL